MGAADPTWVLELVQKPPYQLNHLPKAFGRIFVEHLLWKKEGLGTVHREENSVCSVLFEDV